MNPYLRNTKYTKKKSQYSGDYFEEGGWGDALTPDWLETPLQYYSKKYKQAMNVIPGVDTGVKGKGNVINLVGPGMALTTLGDFFSELYDYSDTQKAAATRNQEAWSYKVDVAQKLKKASPWPENIPKKFLNLGKAIPNVNLSIVLGVPPNSVADAYAQGAIFAYLTANMYKKPEFVELGNNFVFQAKRAPQSVKKPEIEINLDDPVGTIKSFAKADKVVQAMKNIRKQWLKKAKETDIFPAWYNIPGQLSREWDGASEIDNRLKLFAQPNEINFSRGIAEQSQSSFSDLLQVMRTPLILAGVSIAGVFLFPVVAPLLPTIGRGVVSAGRGVGKLASSTVRMIGASAKSGIEQAVKQGVTDKITIENIVAKQLKNENQNVSEDDIRKIIRQQLRSLK